MDIDRYQTRRQQQHRPQPPVVLDRADEVLETYIVPQTREWDAGLPVGNTGSSLLYRPTVGGGGDGLSPIHAAKVEERHHYLHVTAANRRGGASPSRTDLTVSSPPRGSVQTSPRSAVRRVDHSTFSSMLHASTTVRAHDQELTGILQYLKNYYGQEEDEGMRGLDTMTADDVLALAQCFYLDVFRLLRDKRLEGGATNASSISRANDPYNSYIWGPTPQHVGVPIHEDTEPDSPAKQTEVVAPPAPVVNPAIPVLKPQNSVIPSPVSTQEEERAYEPPTPRVQRTVSSASTPRNIPPKLHTPSTRPVTEGRRLSVSIQPPPITHPNVAVHSEESDGPAVHRTWSPALQPVETRTNASLLVQPLQHQRRSVSPFEVGLDDGRPPPRSVQLVPLRSAMPLLQKGSFLIKFARHGGKPQRRFVFLKDLPIQLDAGTSKRNTRPVLVPHLCWSGGPTESAKETLSMLRLLDVKIGSNDNFRRDRKSGRITGPSSQAILEEHCFTLIFDSRSVDLAAEYESDFQLWAGGMLSILKRNQELEV